MCYISVFINEDQLHLLIYHTVPSPGNSKL